MKRRDFFKVCGGAAAVAAVATSISPIINPPKASGVTFPLGKLPPVKGAARLALKDYVDPKGLPTPPMEFGNEGLVPNWNMLGNDRIGDCAVAGPLHSLMLWHAEAGTSFPVSTQAAIWNYSEISGYDETLTDQWGNNPTDNGCVMAEVAEYWRTKGMQDAAGQRHKVDCYLTLEPGDVDELWSAMYLFDGVGIGLEFPRSWMTDFQHGVAWDVVNEQPAGGHFVTATGRRNGCASVVTWGKNQLLTAGGYSQRNDETIAFLSKERLKQNGKDINLLDWDKLTYDMNALPGKHS